MPVTSPEVVDLQFGLQGEAVPEDYADALWLAIRAVLPWLADDAQTGIHPLSGVSPGENVWYLSRRSRLTMRLRREQVTAAQALAGARLQLADSVVKVGAAQVRELQVTPVLYAKFVAVGAAADTAIAEEDFLAACRVQLAALGMTPNLICGKAQRARTADGLLCGFSLMLLGLDKDQNLAVQCVGLGGERKRGCGIFVPHRSTTAVATLE
jgi:CRISPR-associated protein Cas6